MTRQQIGSLWIQTSSNNTKQVGLSSHSLKHIEDIEWIGLPKKGERILMGAPLFVIESSKAALEIESPFDCTVLCTQTCSESFIEQLKQSPEKTWLLELSLDALGAE